MTTIATEGVTITTKTAGIVSSIFNSGTINIGINCISGGDWDGAWKAGVVGIVTGAWNVSGGLGMVKGFGAKSDWVKLTGKLGYQMIGTVGNSIGNNWANGDKLLSKVTLGVGPINLTLGKGQKLIQLQNNIGNIAMNAFGITNLAFGGNIKYDWKNLSINYTGGLIDRMYNPNKWASGFSPHVVTGNSRLEELYRHELHHLWQSRAFNDLFLLNYGLQGINALLLKGNFVKERYYYEDYVDYYNWW